MHELSLAMQIRQTVLKAAAEHEVEAVLEVDIQIGELSLFNREQVEFWLRQLFRDTVAEGADISVEAIAPTVKCEQCGYEGPVEVPTIEGFTSTQPAHRPQPAAWFMAALRCPRCEASGITIERGREVIIKNLRVHKSAPGQAHA